MKKILSYLISLTLVFSVFVPCTASEASAVSTAKESFYLVSALNIDEGINEDNSALVTRAEFAAMVIRAINIESVAAVDGSFEDVAASMPLAKEIYTAKAMGITNGTAAGLFTPDGNVTANAALKMMLVAMGYENMAVALGGYPTGYNILEAKLGLLDGVKNTENLTVGEAKRVIENALEEDVAVFSNVSGDDISYTTEKGKTILTENWKLYTVQGIVTKAGYLTIEDEISDDDYVTIAGHRFKSLINCEKYFGMDVSAYVGKEDNFVYAVVPTLENNEVVIDAKDIFEYRNGSLMVYDGSKEKRYSIDSGVTFIENGRIIAHTESDFLFDDGTLRLLDNDGDKVYDFAFAEKWQYFVVSAINQTGKIIYDKKSPIGFVELEEEQDRVVLIVNENGEKALFSQIKVGDVLKAVCSRDMSVCKVVLGETKTISAIAQELSDKSVIIDGKEYVLNTYFKNLGVEITPGKNYSFILAGDGTVTALGTNAGDDIKYGFYLAFARKKGLENECRIKLLDSSNNINVYELAEHITLDGQAKVSKTDSRIDTLFATNGHFNYQLIRYALDKDGKINMIDTNDSALNEDWELDDSLASNNKLTQYIEYGSVNYRGGSAHGAPGFSFKNAVIFVVPTSLHSSQEPRDYDDDLFSATTYQTLENNRYYDCDVYDFDENYYPKAIVIYEDREGEVISNEAQCHLVYSVTEAINKEGEHTKLVRTYSNGQYYQLFVDTEKLDKLTMPNPGDMVRIALSPGNEIVNVTVDVALKEDGTTEIKYVSDYIQNLSYIAGYAVKFGGGGMTLKATSFGGTLLNSAKIAPLPLGYTPRYLVYDISEQSVSRCDPMDIKTADVVGLENADHVVCRLSYYAICDVIIYKD